MLALIDRILYLGRTNIELYRDCKAHCEEAKGHLVRCVKCRQSLNCGINLQFVKPKKVGTSKISNEKKWGKKSNFIPNMRRKCKQKRKQQTNSR